MKRTCLALCAALLLVAAAALPAAAAGRVAVTGGEARLDLDHGLARQLDRLGVDVDYRGDATVSWRRVKLPVVAGATNGDAGRGALTVAGGFAFERGRRRAAVGDVLINTGRGQTTARIAGERRILARHGALRTEPAGFATRIRVATLRMTRGTARTLNRRLGLRNVFRAGRRLGSYEIVAEPAALPVTRGMISVGGPGTAFAKLESIGAQIGIWGSTSRWAAPGETYFVFGAEPPSEVAPDGKSGLAAADADDGITFEVHAPPPRNMLLRGPRVDIGSAQLSATIGSLSGAEAETAVIADLDYTGAVLNPRPRARTVELTGVGAIANERIAAELNRRFATNIFAPGELLARVSLTLSTG